MAEEPTTEPGQEPTPSASEGQEPETFDRDYVEKLRKEAASYRTKLKEIEPLAEKARELEDAQKSESEKLTEKLTAAERRAQEAETALLRSHVAQETGLPPVLANRLTGSTKEELEADAKALLEAFPQTPSNGKPKENLRPGGESDDTPTVDPKKLAESIWSSNQY